MRLLFATQVVDADHPALAQTIDVVDALARRVDEVVVVCDHVGRHALPGNVRFRTFGSGSRGGRGVRFCSAVAAEVTGPRARRPHAVLSHMIPVFLSLAWPFARAGGAPLLLWYTHWNADRSLRVATRLADRVLSVDRRSFPIDTPKVRGIGHAIDTTVFAPLATRATADGEPLRLLALGRTAPWKGYGTMLEALRLATVEGLDARLEIRGPSLTAHERAYRAELERAAAADPALAERVVVRESVARDLVPGLIRDADAFLSANQPGEHETLDKVVFEAAACAVPVVASNDALDAFLGGLSLPLRFPAGDAAALADLLVRLGRAEHEARAEIGRALRERVVHGHSVETWGDGVVAAIEELRGGRHRGAAVPSGSA